MEKIQKKIGDLNLGTPKIMSFSEYHRYAQNDLILKLQNLHQAYIHLNYDKALAKEPSHFWRDFAYSYQHSITI